MESCECDYSRTGLRSRAVATGHWLQRNWHSMILRVQELILDNLLSWLSALQTTESATWTKDLSGICCSHKPLLKPNAGGKFRPACNWFDTHDSSRDYSYHMWGLAPDRLEIRFNQLMPTIHCETSCTSTEKKFRMRQSQMEPWPLHGCGCICFDLCNVEVREGQLLSNTIMTQALFLPYSWILHMVYTSYNFWWACVDLQFKASDSTG